MKGQHFLFLQGEPTTFYKRVGQGLASLGCKVTRINFCAGDQLFWYGPNTLSYRGPLSEWPDYFSKYLDANAVTDVFLCGEQRSYHKIAIEIAQGRSIRVTVTDLGYLRPDWITLERDGMNGNSRFPRDAGEVLALAAGAPKVDLSACFRNDNVKIEMAYLVFELANHLLFFLFPYYRRTDNRQNILLHYLYGIRKLFLARPRRLRESGAVRALLSSGGPYFVFLMQLENDYAVQSYSPFSNLDEPIRQVLKSFAENASASSRLVFKCHPLDSEVKDWRSLIFQWAEAVGIAHRIDCFGSIDLDEILSDAQGAITVNSTAGIRALQLGCPVKVLGEAIYDIEGLTSQRPLGHFWSNPSKPSPDLVDAFLRAIVRTIQVRGVFFNEPGLSAAVSGTVVRLISQNVGLPS